MERTKRILGAVNRSAGASGFLRDLFLKEYDRYDGMVNNESAVMTANRQLTTEGREPLYVIYPVDGLAIADWPLGFIDRGDQEKADLFAKFQQFLLSDEVQQELLGLGRRTELGINPINADPAIFNPDWGIDINRAIVPITPPSAEVILEALTLYQTVLRKPSFTVYCLDFSGSMDGKGEKQLKEGMTVLLEPDQASRYLLQTGANDITIVIPFDSNVMAEWRIEGNDPAVLRDLLAKVNETQTDGGTNIYSPVIAALDAMESVNLETYSPAVILLTDGRSNEGSWGELEARLAEESPGNVPVYSILFGDASEDQLERIADATFGRVFDGRSDLIGALRQARGYN
jgi:Ca-activated chloride channel family protein